MAIVTGIVRRDWAAPGLLAKILSFLGVSVAPRPGQISIGDGNFG
jgi:hypothetical protein